MTRNMSFSLTTEQIRNRTKTVTRRRGWTFVKPGDLINACVKCMGLRPGEKIQKLCQLRVIDVRREHLSEMCRNRTYRRKEAKREGFPEMRGHEFVLMFCQHMGGDVDQVVTRIEFAYVNEE